MSFQKYSFKTPTGRNLVISPLNTIGAGRPYLTNGKISESRSMSHLQADMTLNMTWSSGYSSRIEPLQDRVRVPNPPQKKKFSIFIINNRISAFRWCQKYCSDLGRVSLFLTLVHGPVSALVPRAEKETSDTGEKNGSRRPWSENTRCEVPQRARQKSVFRTKCSVLLYPPITFNSLQE